MSTTAASTLAYDPTGDRYDPDEVLLAQNSPLMKPYHPQLGPPTSSLDEFSYPKVSPPSSPSNKRSDRRFKSKPSQGDAVLLHMLDGGRRPEIAIQAGLEALPSEHSDSDRDDSLEPDTASSMDGNEIIQSPHFNGEDHDDIEHLHLSLRRRNMSAEPSREINTGGGFDSLQSLAAGALGVVQNLSAPSVKQEEADAGPTPPITEHDTATVQSTIAARRAEADMDTDRSTQPAMLTPYSPRGITFSPREPGSIPSIASPTNPLTPNSLPEGLPPIHPTSPVFEGASQQTLPSIRDSLGVADLNQLSRPIIERSPLQPYPGSPPGFPTSLLSYTNHASPPQSASDPYRREPVSPYFFSQGNGLQRPHDYASGSEPSASDHSRSHMNASATSPGSIADRMSIDGLTSHTGTYVCKFQGCNAAPFQTQYLLNSHANVHSSARPHYCPVPGCSRGEGGRGFKRKNEMIRHGLVHDSPGYVCPFCPDREHKYPRPDNLQRHVRVHHTDKDKDDPLLREVLAQRPDGPSRGRRRRGGPS
ncbi:hypothetical protein NEUTE1DRAFT_121942 [Neurospora tetrasperma FGSC 2508]|uniref:C2H2-type domain-containing protein n=1 Tax=Neurospora tetrasperma (strain FGSC 2508 / ATCC MYA-4615 / P0657) TaxID=510951 RepID=F8ML67_NEUT8|nr:uncharacterized protein NEUTE1DRAFT_121942 [Neurospora tetrasperma FGSC 2508]EGO57542.1 hypothetical protein NEUTE1DRAFT_121942 [Neurospora tetrasperma FGSC 2508]EGZ72199.1 hypothetical protein NEUTE2DRAFT_111596 [Neurospora tetrasperma FGSC 2509]